MYTGKGSAADDEACLLQHPPPCDALNGRVAGAARAPKTRQDSRNRQRPCRRSLESMDMNARRCLLTLASAALVACAQQPVRSPVSPAPHDGTQIDYARYVTRPVPSFRFSSLYD